MLKNIYAPLSGAMAQERLLDVLANNIANTNTTGYKEETVTFKKLLSDPWPSYASPIPPAQFKQDMSEVFPLRGNEMEFVGVSDIGTNYEQGSLKQTGNLLDFAIENSGFFQLQTPFGERYTRDGSFSLAPNGTLLSKNGSVVMGEKGPITGLNSGTIRVNNQGEIFLNEDFVDKFKLVNPEDHKLLQKVGNNTFVHDGPPENLRNSESKISQGFLESSNVNPVKNMTNLILAHRNYEALQKTIKTHDEALSMANNKVGVVQ